MFEKHSSDKVGPQPIGGFETTDIVKLNQDLQGVFINQFLCNLGIY